MVLLGSSRGVSLLMGEPPILKRHGVPCGSKASVATFSAALEAGLIVGGWLTPV